VPDRNLFCCAGRPHGDLRARYSGFIDEDAPEVSGSDGVALRALDASVQRCDWRSSRVSTPLDFLSLIPFVKLIPPIKLASFLVSFFDKKNAARC
jgi:hypothetical protein